jgi:glycerol-3-phosphate dehydrogenase
VERSARSRHTRADVATLLDRLNSQLRSPINPDQILGVFAGLRPLVAAPNSRRLRIVVDPRQRQLVVAHIDVFK